MSLLQKGQKIQTKDFKTVTIIGDKPLGEGGQGAVYKVDYNGKNKALKWYTGTQFSNPKKFYENLENNIKKGKPNDSFLWPEAITEKQGQAFGYIMDIYPPEFKDFSLFLIGKEGFSGIMAMCNSALQVTAGFRALHRKGYSYQDLNDGNFCINPKNGQLLILDNDNVSAEGVSSGIAGKCGFMAPEIITKGAKPNSLTDMFSLAVILFLLWNKDHPLKGKLAWPPLADCMTPKLERKLFAEGPIFIWDPKDDSNRPNPALQKGAIMCWGFLPEYLKDAFIRAFSKELMHDPQKRIIEQEWLRIFIRMRGEAFKCGCGEAYFADPVANNPCPECKKKNPFPMYFKTQRYNVPIHQRTRLYGCHTGHDGEKQSSGSDDFETLTGEVFLNGNTLALKNVSKNNWDVTTGTATATVAPGSAFALSKGMTINFGVSKAEVL